MRERNADENCTYPIGIIARSNPLKRSPISLKAGHTGLSASSSPSLTDRYPVSPAKYTFLPSPSTAQLDQRVFPWSSGPRPVKCCAGVQVSLKDVPGISTRRASHQSSVCACPLGIPIDLKCFSLPSGAKICGSRDRLKSVDKVWLSRLGEVSR